MLNRLIFTIVVTLVTLMFVKRVQQRVRRRRDDIAHKLGLHG